MLMADAGMSAPMPIAPTRRPARRAGKASGRARPLLSAPVSVSESPATAFFRHRLLPTLGAVDRATLALVIEQLVAAELPALLFTDPLGLDLTFSLSFNHCFADESLQAWRIRRQDWQLGLSVVERPLPATPLSLPVDFVCARRAASAAHDSAHPSPRYLPLCSSLRQLPRLLDAGCEQLAIRPTDLASGLTLLQTLAQHAPSLPVLVLGAIARHDAPLYLQQRNVAAVSAPWIFSPELMRRQQWSQIRDNAQAAVRLCR